MIHQIKHRYSGAVLFECDVPEQHSRMAARYTLEQAALSKADLRCANLRSADLSFGKATGRRPFFTIGPIGSRADLVQLWLTDKGPYVKAGCFTGTIDEFATAVEKTHGETDHAKEYAMAILMMESHAALWGETL